MSCNAVNLIMKQIRMVNFKICGQLSLSIHQNLLFTYYFLIGFNVQLDVLMLNITIKIHLFSKKQRK